MPRMETGGRNGGGGNGAVGMGTDPKRNAPLRPPEPAHGLYPGLLVHSEKNPVARVSPTDEMRRILIKSGARTSSCHAAAADCRKYAFTAVGLASWIKPTARNPAGTRFQILVNHERRVDLSEHRIS
jgi:hypothetical protein